MKPTDLRDHSKRLVPLALVPSVVARRVDRLFENERFRQGQERQMRYLLERTHRAGEVPELARGFAMHTILRTYLRWHPEELTQQPIRDVEWLTTRRDPTRGAILNFMHHGWYEGLFTSLRRAGAPVTIVGSTQLLTPDTSAGHKQHMRVVMQGNDFIPAIGGLAQIEARLRPGMTMALASDVPGRTEVTFLGRRVLASFGAAVIAMRTNSPVVVVTPHREDGTHAILVHEPLEPHKFAEPLDLLNEMLARHAAAVLDWPEAFEMPRARFGILEE